MPSSVLSEQATVRCAIIRAGTSKGLFFHREDLPEPRQEQAILLKRLMGTPDVLQIDGLGGSLLITSKVAIVSRSDRADADVDYTFAQISIEEDMITFDSTCGNISAGVGPFAVDEGLVEAVDGMTKVRIYNTNTGKILVAHVPVRNGMAVVAGDFAISGVPGTGAEIPMDWTGTIGAKTGRLLPTGNVVDKIELRDGRTVELTLVDVANPCFWLRADDLGLTGSELVEDINTDRALLATVQEIRGKAAVMYGFCRDWERADDETPGLPMVGMVAPAAGYTTMSGERVDAAHMHLRTRLIAVNRLHESMAAAGAISVAAASRVRGSVVHEMLGGARSDPLWIGHPSGLMPVRVISHENAGEPGVDFELLGVSRTSRRLADCVAYYPRSVVRPAEQG
jgi:2-methylaconitate cis-trans-isomerase PrpF